MLSSTMAVRTPSYWDDLTYVFFADWNSPIATDEFSLTARKMPAAGKKFTYYVPHLHTYIGGLLYSAVVLDGCGNTPFFPVTLDSWVLEGGEEIGAFSATDNTTIQPNGYWNFSYKIRVTDVNGGVSDIKAKGIISALCTNVAAAVYP